MQRLLVEAAVEYLPHAEQTVTTPNGSLFQGQQLTEPLCGVSIIRAGESFEGPLREVLPGVPIGKMLIQRDKRSKRPDLLYSHLPQDVAYRRVLLMDPMLAIGGTACLALSTLLQTGVPLEHVTFLCLITVPEGLAAVRAQYPAAQILSSALDDRLNQDAFMVPGIGDFGDRDFGTTR